MSLIISHAQYERDHPKDREYQEGLQNLRRLRFADAHGGSDAGYTPTRLFPCPGWLHTFDTIGDICCLECDVCHFEISVKDRQAEWAR